MKKQVQYLIRAPSQIFCKTQHLKYVDHVTQLDNFSFQKQLLFSCEHKKYSRDRWVKMEKELNISKMQIQRILQNKKVHGLTISNLHVRTL